MVLSYAAGVILLSLALYGLWCVLYDTWSWLAAVERKLPLASWLITVRNCDQEIEELIRHLMREANRSEGVADVVVADCGSWDLTPAILERLQREYTLLTVVRGNEMVGKTLVLAASSCRGGVIHVMDGTSRMEHGEIKALAQVLARLERGRGERNTGL